MFSLQRAPDGSRLLLNLDNVFGFGEDQAGNAIAIAITGAQVSLGVPLDQVITDLEEAEEELPQHGPGDI